MNLNDYSGPMCRPFGIPFIKFNLNPALSIQDELLDKADFLRKRDRHKNKSNMGGFHSDEIAELDWNTFEAGQWFTESINQTLIKTMRLLQNSRTPDITLELTNSWYVISRAGQSDWIIPHSHPNSYLSGAFYLKVKPEVSGSVERGKGTGKFIAIIENASVNSLQPHEHDAKLVEYAPVEGEVILFPSTTLHMVSPHTADYDRVMISFNTRIKIDDTLS